ncbi:MAG: hypothetical protein ACOX9C_06050 [Kiritimatiellia bacterium]|jgi:hypothetical protein
MQTATIERDGGGLCVLNRIPNPTPKDDPPAIPANKLYLVESADLSCYQAGLEIACTPSGALSKMVAAVHCGGEKIQGSDTLFLPNGKATLVFDDASTFAGITDHPVKVGLDSNGNRLLDDNEILPGFVVKHPATGNFPSGEPQCSLDTGTAPKPCIALPGKSTEPESFLTKPTKDCK